MFKIQIRSPNGLGGKTAPSFKDSWEVLRSAMSMIYDGRVGELSFEGLFNVVYSLTLRRQGAELYEKIGGFFEEKVCELRNPAIESSTLNVLSALLEVWDKHCESLRLISDITMYLDKVYCKENRRQLVYDMGLEKFRGLVLKASKDDVHSLMGKQINDARLRSKNVDFQSLKSLIAIMETLTDVNDTYYLTEFEPSLLEETKAFYRNFIQNYNSEATSYPKEVQALLKDEQEMDAKFLNQDIVIKIRTVVEGILVSENMQFVGEQVIPELLRKGMYSDLGLMFSLSRAPQEKKRLWKQCSQYISNEGLSIAEDFSLKKRTQVAVKWVTEVIALKKKYETVLRDMAEDDSTDVKAVNEAFSVILNQNGKRNADFLAMYLDFLLRSSTAEESTKMQMEETIAMFKLLREKDVFERLYQQQLSKRLLQQRSSIKLEKYLVNRMKDEVGGSFTLKPEGMFRDISVSQINNSKFHQSYQIPYAYDMSVLTWTCWPFQQTSNEKDIILPTALESVKLDYENYYMKTYSGRVLTWAYHLGSLDIGFQFKKSYHVITMPIYAAIIFMLFEDHEELTAQEIGELTNIPDNELIRNLLTIAIAPKTRLLKKQPMSKKVLPSDKFRINYSFSAPTTKVKVLAVLNKAESETQQSSGNGGLTSDILGERRQNVEAAIVRVMKSSQKLYLDQLFEKVREAVALRFQLDLDTLQTSVDKLVEREYMQRDPDDSTFYHYLP
ncbi:LAFA_0E07382g1_1 [Lachancea sp. 'fantastica']|nr:LAFA_0E07382g1_1 [Lachancea sp. 'fantastica']